MKMKIILVVLVAIVLVLSHDANARLVSFTTSGYYDGDFHAKDTNFDGIADTTGSQNWCGVDEVTATDAECRMFLDFSLPALAAGESIQSAELRLHRTSYVGVPSDADLYHLRDKNTTVVSKTYFQAPATLAVTGAVLAGGGHDRIYTMDVTSEVQSDYANDPAESQYSIFRLQAQTVTNDNDGVSHLHKLATALYTDPMYQPTLTLTIVPEPATMILLLGGALGMVIRRKK